MKNAYGLMIVVLSTVISINSLAQVSVMKRLHARQAAALTMAREGNKMGDEGMKSISVLYEVDKITDEIERLALESDRISSGVSLEDMITIRGGGTEGEKTWNKIVNGPSRGSLAVFMRSVDLGKKNLEYGKISLRNTETILDTMRWVNTQWPTVIQSTEEMNRLTEQYISIMQDSKTLSATMLENTRKGNQKLQRFIKYFRRIKKEKEKELEQEKQNQPVTTPGTETQQP